MNTLIVGAADFIDENTVRIDGRRAQHIKQVLKKSCGDTLRAGIVNGAMGEAIIHSDCDTAITAKLHLNKPSPETTGISMLLALPRPKMLKRMLRSCAELGVDEITLINAYKVEKSYWQSPLLGKEQLREYCILGLEQASHTHLPTIHIEKRFKPYVEDRLPSLLKNRRGFVAHPGSEPETSPIQRHEKLLFALGPEGGFIDYEVEKLTAAGCQPLDLGRFILRCDTALPYAMATLAARRL